MKTAENILFEFDSPRVDYGETLFTGKDCLQAMKMYANAKLDEAAEAATVMVEEVGCKVVVKKQSILKLKDQI